MLALVQPLSAAPPSAKPRARPRRPPTPDAAAAIADPLPPAPVRPPPPSATLDIDSYPPQKLLRLLASLLTQIAATNDALAPAVAPAASLDNPVWRSLTAASRAALATPSATLTFHARNIPTISLEAYLLRILKYCPTTNQVFLSLLVYFDRMSKLTADATARTFVIDSYNIHRLVIAGVTVASKFFSDVFYTNSRYAKVGGLPLTELNQLELQFLLLNDFRLVISSSEMQRYAEQLILFSQSHTDYVSPMTLSIPPSSIPDHTPTVTPVSHIRPTGLPPPPAVTSSSPQHQQTSDPSQATSMRTMGAIDAYGGRVPGDVPRGYPMTREHHPQHSGPSSADGAGAGINLTRTPNARLVRRDSTSTADDTETETENETGTETGTETDADETSTTDDEPTIRPGRTSIAGSVYSVASVSSAGSGSSGGRAGSGESAVNGHITGMSRSDKESDVCSVRSFDTGDEGGDEYENDEEMEEDARPPLSSDAGRMDVVDDGERTPETNAESIRGVVKRPRRERGVESGSRENQQGQGERLSVDWEGDLGMRSPRP